MEGEQSQTYENLNHETINEEHVYELSQVSATEERRPEEPKNIKKRKNKELTTGNKRIIIIIVLLSLIVILQVGILCLLLANISTRDTTCTVHNDSTALPTSCKEIKERQPLSPSGVYQLAPANGGATYTAYCNVGTLCGSGGGWTRLAYLDMSDATQNCPSGFKLYQSGGVRACGRPVTNSGNCASVQFPSNGISYSQICGRVTGYQYGHTDGLHGSSVIDTHYLEGVSITHGSPRQHVWTLIAGYNESSSASNACPCNTGSSVSVQSFIGNNYFCESGNPNISTSDILYTSDPLWDGQGCNSLESPCCNVPGIPWFHRDYGSTTTTDYIELRVCGDYHANNVGGEDSPVSYYEIYVK